VKQTFGTLDSDMLVNKLTRMWLTKGWQQASNYQNMSKVSFCEGYIARKIKITAIQINGRDQFQELIYSDICGQMPI